MMNETYSLAKIAEIIGRPKTTVTTWKNTFMEFIPPHDGKPKPKYPPLAIEIFKAIHIGYTKGLDTDQIKAKLILKYPINVTNESPTDVYTEELATIEPPTYELIEQNKQLLQAMGKMYQEITELKETVNIIAQSNENIHTNTNALIDEAKSLKTEIKAQNEWAVHKVEDTLKKIEENKNNPWWRKMFK